MEEYIQPSKSPEAIPWNIWDMVKGAAVAIAIAIIFIIAMVFSIIALVGMPALHDIASQNLDSAETLQAIIDSLKADGRLNITLALMFLFMLLGEVAIPLGAWLFSVRKYRCGWGTLGFRKFDVQKGLLLALAITAIGIGISIGYEVLLEYLRWEDSSNIYAPFDENALGMALFGITAVIAAPLAEEIFFRGFLFQGLGKRLKFAWAAIISAAIFAIGHFSLSGLVPIFILGLMLAWLFNKTKSIWPCIIVHAAYNSIALIFMIIS